MGLIGLSPSSCFLYFFTSLTSQSPKLPLSISVSPFKIPHFLYTSQNSVHTLDYFYSYYYFPITNSVLPIKIILIALTKVFVYLCQW